METGGSRHLSKKPTTELTGFVNIGTMRRGGVSMRSFLKDGSKLLFIPIIIFCIVFLSASISLLLQLLFEEFWVGSFGLLWTVIALIVVVFNIFVLIKYRKIKEKRAWIFCGAGLYLFAIVCPAVLNPVSQTSDIAYINPFNIALVLLIFLGGYLNKKIT